MMLMSVVVVASTMVILMARRVLDTGWRTDAPLLEQKRAAWGTGRR
jgi:hypothetical protein